MNLSQQTILITGGSSGIGLELARQLIELDNTVIVTGRDQTKLDEVKRAHPRVKTVRSDVASAADALALRQTVIKEFPALNVLVNNAGIMRKIDLNTPTDALELLTREIEINLMGPIRMTQLFLPHLKTRPHAAIVNVSSGLAFAPLPIAPVYSATKSGLHAFTACLRVQLRASNVQVFELAPPAVDTPLLSDDFSREDLGGVKSMDVSDLVAAALAGLREDQPVITPGASKLLRVMSRVAPGFLLKQMSKPADQ